MNIIPAIDLYEGKVVRLLYGDYSKMTVFSDDPLGIAKDFEAQGAKHIHIVDLEGAKNGTTPNIKTVETIIKNTSLSAEVGGGIRSEETVEKYLDIGAERIILGTAAVENRGLLVAVAGKHPENIAVGADIKDGFVAVKGWTVKTNSDCFGFCREMEEIGVNYLICTDISKDGAMAGTNIPLYKRLSEELKINIIASGGISSLEDVKRLAGLDIFGAIIGKAYYTGAISIKEATEVVL